LLQKRAPDSTSGGLYEETPGVNQRRRPFLLDIATSRRAYIAGYSIGTHVLIRKERTAMTREHRAFLGTRRGVFTLRSQDGRCSWQLDAPALPGYEINHVAADPRDPLRVYATANHAVWGPQIQISRDGGRSWTAAAQSPAFAPDDGRAVKSLWFIRP